MNLTVVFEYNFDSLQNPFQSFQHKLYLNLEILRISFSSFMIFEYFACQYLFWLNASNGVNTTLFCPAIGTFAARLICEVSPTKLNVLLQCFDCRATNDILFKCLDKGEKLFQMKARNHFIYPFIFAFVSKICAFASSLEIFPLLYQRFPYPWHPSKRHSRRMHRWRGPAASLWWQFNCTLSLSFLPAGVNHYCWISCMIM